MNPLAAYQGANRDVSKKDKLNSPDLTVAVHVVFSCTNAVGLLPLYPYSGSCPESFDGNRFFRLAARPVGTVLASKRAPVGGST